MSALGTKKKEQEEHTPVKGHTDTNKGIDADDVFEALKVMPKGPKDRMALYISRPIAKEFKKLAIDEGTDYSTLAELVFRAFLKSCGKNLNGAKN